MSNIQVNTVLGPISPDDMGPTLPHEHLCYGYPGWEGDATIAPLDPEGMIAHGVEVLEELKQRGLGTYVDATTNDCGRQPEIMREVSKKTGIHIICSTGYYYEEEGAPVYWKFRSTLGDIRGELHELFLKEVTEGIRDTGIKAGAIKVGSSKGEITPYEKLLFEAAAKVQAQTGVPIITHTQGGTMGPQQARLLMDAGADPKRIQIGHMSDNLNIDYQIATLETGVFVAWDRMGLQGVAGCPMDEERYDVLAELIKRGYAGQIMISHDFIINWLGRPLNLPAPLLQLLAQWNPTHLFDHIIPQLEKRGVTQEQIRTIVEDNPRRLYGGE